MRHVTNYKNHPFMPNIVRERHLPALSTTSICWFRTPHEGSALKRFFVQSKSNAYTVSDFDWKNHVISFPTGRQSPPQYTDRHRVGNKYLCVHFLWQDQFRKRNCDSTQWMMSQNKVKHGTRSQRKEPTEDLELFPLHARMQDIMTSEQVLQIHSSLILQSHTSKS